jgi:hypothetical protein
MDERPYSDFSTVKGESMIYLLCQEIQKFEIKILLFG